MVWSYDCLAADLYALTRVRYAGFTYDGRTGNFFAHSLVFAAGDLAVFGANPLALARSGTFLASAPGDGTSLPVLAAPEPAGALERWGLAWEPYRERLPALITALAAAAVERPVLLCLADWGEAAGARRGPPRPPSPRGARQDDVLHLRE